MINCIFPLPFLSTWKSNILRKKEHTQKTNQQNKGQCITCWEWMSLACLGGGERGIKRWGKKKSLQVYSL